MTTHAIHVVVDRYEKQYGYAYSFSLTCSCGHMVTKMSGSDFEPEVRKHREQAILDALGLSFVTTKENTF